MKLKKEIFFSIKVGVVIFSTIFFIVLFCNIYGFIKTLPMVGGFPVVFINQLILFYLKLPLLFFSNAVIFGTVSAFFWYFLSNSRIANLKIDTKILLHAISILTGLSFIMIRTMIYQPSFFNRYFNDRGGFLRDFHVTGVQTCALPISVSFFY